MPTSVAHHRDRLNVGSHMHFIGGEWVAGGDGSFEQVHPSTNETTATFPEGGAEAVKCCGFRRAARVRRRPLA